MRKQWDDSRILMGKNTVLAVGLGHSEEYEYRECLHLVSESLQGSIALLFTNRSKEEVMKFFDEYKELDYARAGWVATETVSFEPCDLKEYNMPHTMLEQLKKLSLPCSLNRGVLTLDRAHVVCKEGDILSPEQAQLLKLFWKPLAWFRIVVQSFWTDGRFEVLAKPAAGRGAGAGAGTMSDSD